MTQQLEFDLYIAPDGKEYSFHDRRSRKPDGRFLDLSADGLGMPDITYVTQRGPFQHGETVLDYRLQARTIAYAHRRTVGTRSEFWDARAELLNALRPNRQAAGTFALGKLRKILPAGQKRDIDALILSGPVFAAQGSGDDTRGFAEAIKFYCPDPTFYDPAAVTVTLSGSFCDDLILPFTLPFTLCMEGEVETDQVTYTGTWLSYPTISIAGPITDLEIRNLTTGEKLHLIAGDGDIAAGRNVTIDCAYGHKSVTDDTGANLLGVLSTDSDLATFHIAPDPEAPGGVNSFSVSGYNTTVQTQLYMTYYTRYIGL